MNKREQTALEIEDDFDTAEVPTSEIKAMRPFSELVAQHKRMGRPPKENPKVATNLRLDSEVLDFFRAEGDGWQTRMNDVLLEHVRERKSAA